MRGNGSNKLNIILLQFLGFKGYFFLGNVMHHMLKIMKIKFHTNLLTGIIRTCKYFKFRFYLNFMVLGNILMKVHGFTKQQMS